MLKFHAVAGDVSHKCDWKGPTSPVVKSQHYRRTLDKAKVCQ